MNTHLAALLKRHTPLAACGDDITGAFTVLRDCYRAGGKVLLCGNGGSAADAEHWAGELLKGFCSMRSLTQTQRETLPPDIGGYLQGSLPAIPLSSFLALSTAFSNDAEPSMVYAQLVWGLGKENDVLVALSTSGNSENVLYAVKTANAMNMKTVGLTGRSGGALSSLVDVCITVPETETYLVQEYHLPVYHCLCRMLENEFFRE